MQRQTDSRQQPRRGKLLRAGPCQCDEITCILKEPRAEYREKEDERSLEERVGEGHAAELKYTNVLGY